MYKATSDWIYCSQNKLPRSLHRASSLNLSLPFIASFIIAACYRCPSSLPFITALHRCPSSLPFIASSTITPIASTMSAAKTWPYLKHRHPLQCHEAKP
jgi:hypothetical protein